MSGVTPFSERPFPLFVQTVFPVRHKNMIKSQKSYSKKNFCVFFAHIFYSPTIFFIRINNGLINCIKQTCPIFCHFVVFFCSLRLISASIRVHLFKTNPRFGGNFNALCFTNILPFPAEIARIMAALTVFSLIES